MSRKASRNGLTAVKCRCGAVTVSGPDFSNSMSPATMEEEFPDIPVPREAGYAHCNHCVNHWGIDLCGCGSGEKVGECGGDFEQCRLGIPAQAKGEMKDSGVQAMIRRGGFA